MWKKTQFHVIFSFSKKIVLKRHAQNSNISKSNSRTPFFLYIFEIYIKIAIKRDRLEKNDMGFTKSLDPP